jgi:mannose-6-phosphate isomerase-like protein (cupin superfamily)
MPRASETPLDLDTVNVNFRISERDRRGLKLWCVENDMTMTDALVAGTALLRALHKQFGPRSAKTIINLVESASVFLVDRDQDLRVERHDEETWMVHEGTSVVNRDGEREHLLKKCSQDEAFLRRTRFELADALRVAWARAGKSE